MKIVSINLGNFGSTGGIMRGVTYLAREKGHEAYMAYPWSRKCRPNGNNDILIGNRLYNAIISKISHFTGLINCLDIISTIKFLKTLDTIKPDVLHLHNLHDSYINLPLLFRYIKKHKVKVIWTLHDCWAFTGHCPHFDMVGCEKWKTGCYDCPSYLEYPQSLYDNSKFMYNWKKSWFTGVKDMTIVTPSQWLADLVKQSFLKEYNVKVINNGIDLNVFKPTESDFRKRHGIENKYMLLGVAFGWGKRKGLDVFIELSKRLDMNKFAIVLVGTDEKVDKELPNSIISIHRTQNQKELAEIYTAADLFVNPTREENYPTVNMESIACGTPVITFKTGGSPEIPSDACGIVIEKNDIENLIKSIISVYENKFLSKDSCLTRAKFFLQCNRFAEYISVYGEKEC